jgi:hypothetical protein
MEYAIGKINSKMIFILVRFPPYGTFDSAKYASYCER